MVQKIGIIFNMTPLLLLEWDNRGPKLRAKQLFIIDYFLKRLLLLVMIALIKPISEGGLIVSVGNQWRWY